MLGPSASRHRDAHRAAPPLVDHVVVARALAAVVVVYAGVSGGVTEVTVTAAVSAAARNSNAVLRAVVRGSAESFARAEASCADLARGAVAARSAVGVDAAVTCRHASVRQS